MYSTDAYWLRDRAVLVSVGVQFYRLGRATLNICSRSLASTGSCSACLASGLGSGWTIFNSTVFQVLNAEVDGRSWTYLRTPDINMRPVDFRKVLLIGGMVM